MIMKEELIVRVICGKEAGTAFYVAPNLLLTAYHNVSSYTKQGTHIVKDRIDGELSFEVVKNYKEQDVSLLKVSDRKASSFFPSFSHRIRVKEDVISFGYPDKANETGLRAEGCVKQRVHDAAGDYKVQVTNVNGGFEYEGMSGAPVLQDGKVVGVVIEQSGNDITMVSVCRLCHLLISDGVQVEEERKLTDIPDSIAKNVASSAPNYAIMGMLEKKIEEHNSNWLVVFGSPGCGKTVLAAGFEPQSKDIEVLGRLFFKVPNDSMSRAERCSEGHFAEFLESVYIKKSGEDIEKLTNEKRRKMIPGWFGLMDNILSEEGKTGVIIIDGLDELAEDPGYRVGDFLSLLPNTLPQNIYIVLSCISKEILPSNVIEKIAEENYIEVSPLSMAECESFIKRNSGDWEKPYSFIQAVALKTEGHPLYMNYLCRYIVNCFTANTKENELNAWVAGLPSIGGDILAYYDAIWKKDDPNGFVYEVLAVLSQIRGPISEVQLVGMMNNPNPYEHKASTTEFGHLLKERESDLFEIYHSSFRLYITEKLSSVIKQTNDQIAKYCELNEDVGYSIENHLHHVVNGSDPRKGILMCNQEWADGSALHDVSPDLVMNDIKECLSLAVDLSLPLEVVRLMLLAQRIETRCDSIMVDNATEVADLKIIMGKPEVALKYLVRDNILLVDLQTAIDYLRVMFELGYEDQTYELSEAIDAVFRKEASDISKQGISTSTLAIKGYLIVEGVLAGVEGPSDLERYFKLLERFIDKDDDESVKNIRSIQDIIVAYQLSNQLRSGKKIHIDKYLKAFKVDWDERLMMLFIKTLHLYEDKDRGLHRIGFNEAFKDCLQQIEAVFGNHTFTFSADDLQIILGVLVDKSKHVEVVKKLLSDYGPNPGSLEFRKANGVDIDSQSIAIFYQDSLYNAYMVDDMACPRINKDYYGESWEDYVKALISRIAYLDGTLSRKRAAGEDYDAMFYLVEEILKCIDFSFETRVHWKRSYLFPEDLFPFIYDKLALLFCEFFEGKLDVFMEHLQGRMQNQLSLYREGYCAILIRLVGIFGKKTETKGMSLTLADAAFDYIKYAVQNRRERCGYLLDICKEYALLNEKNRVDAVYEEVLNSSMGPDWYKEAQLDLINIYRKCDVKLLGSQSAHLAAIYEEASGEMTFQRDVQQEKNEFVATLAKSSSLVDAIAYYKFETLPSPDWVISNAEDWKVDMPRIGDGYDLGANHLIEASAISYLLLECEDVSPYIRYAISELFWENWDKMHNDYSYAELHADILNSMDEKVAKDVVIPKMADYFVNNYYHNKKGSYLSDLEKMDLPMTLIDCLQHCLSDKGFNWERQYSSNIKETALQTEEETLDNLPTCKSVLDKVRKEIVSPVGSYWYSLRDILLPLVNKSDFDKQGLFEVIAGHYDHNVRPSQQQKDKFSWFVGNREEPNKDELLIRFLIWFLVHPDSKISERAQDSLLWLVNYDDRVVNCLIDEVLCQSEAGISTLASDLLREITISNPQTVIKKLSDESVLKKLCGINNFSVSRNLYEIALLFAEKCNNDGLLKILNPIMPDTLMDRGDVMLDSRDMMFIEHKIDKLNSYKVTGGKEFAKPYMEEIQALEKEGLISKLNKSDIYIRRSFYLNYLPKGRYMRTMEDVLNRVLYGKVDKKRADRVYYAINK